MSAVSSTQYIIRTRRLSVCSVQSYKMYHLSYSLCRTTPTRFVKVQKEAEVWSNKHYKVQWCFIKLFAESAGCAGHLTKVCNAKEEAELLPALVVVYVYHCADLLCPQEVNCQEKHTLGHLNCLNWRMLTFFLLRIVSTDPSGFMKHNMSWQKQLSEKSV